MGLGNKQSCGDITTITPVNVTKVNITRINIEFTEDDELSDLFREELERTINQTELIQGWNPHQKLEFVRYIKLSSIKSYQSFRNYLTL